MSDLTKQSISQIQTLRGELLRYEAAVPNAISYLERITNDITLIGVPNKAMLSSYLDTLCRFEKLVHKVDGNFPRAMFDADEVLQLMSAGYVLLLGNRLIPHTKAMTMLGYKSVVYINLLLYPKRGEPKLTAYFDPYSRYSARVDVEEVKKLVKEMKP